MTPGCAGGRHGDVDDLDLGVVEQRLERVAKTLRHAAQRGDLARPSPRSAR